MIKKTLLFILIVVVATALIWAGVFAWQNLRGIKPVITSPPQDISEIIPPTNKETPLKEVNNTGLPLKLPSGFSISIFAKDLPGARVMRFDYQGNMWVSQTKQGKISLLIVKDGQVVEQREVFTELNRPHGLVFDSQDPWLFYFAEQDKISKVRVYSEDQPKKIIDLPGGGNHFTRTIGFGPDNRLYVSIGSSCNVCEEEDFRRAKIFSLNKDGSDFQEYARGLRNAVFFTWNKVDGRMWATEMGRDLLGDDLPPDEINIVESGEWYGWPWFYGKNIEDYDFSPNSRPSFVKEPKPSYIDIPAHSAPLGLGFIPTEGWPKEYEHDLLVAYHGSWNRSEPTGYKVVRFKLDEQGRYLGVEDFISGWLTEQGRALGRPVDILIQPGGVMYISDDKAGVIYKVTYDGQ
ncbi:PQQ-dependent sugar dehydrogenase [Patescibacteria group bacterium]|nr:PQQ-dependent sugar dehydrogenase [Patescibacteria group bacterium]